MTSTLRRWSKCIWPSHIWDDVKRWDCFTRVKQLQIKSRWRFFFLLIFVWKIGFFLTPAPADLSYTFPMKVLGGNGPMWQIMWDCIWRKGWTSNENENCISHSGNRFGVHHITKRSWQFGSNSLVFVKQRLSLPVSELLDPCNFAIMAVSKSARHLRTGLIRPTER